MALTNIILLAVNNCLTFSFEVKYLKIVDLDNFVIYKMQQVSVWIENRYATTEIGIWLQNKHQYEDQVVQLSYDLRRSDYIDDLHALVGNQRFTGKVMEKDQADERCKYATANGLVCVKVATSNTQPKDLNIYRKFNYEVRIPAGQQLKVWLRYRSIIFFKEEKVTYTVNNYLQNSNSLQPRREVFQVFISEIEDLKSDPKITCNGRKVQLDGIPGNTPETWEYFGVFDASNGKPGLCESGRRQSGRRRQSSGRFQTHLDLPPRRRRTSRRRSASYKVEIEYEVERRIMTDVKNINDRARYAEDLNGFDFPDVGMVNSNGAASAETSLERMSNYYNITKDIQRLASNASLRQSIVDDAVNNNFVTDLTSMYLEDSKEFIETFEYDLPRVLPQSIQLWMMYDQELSIDAR